MGPNCKENSQKLGFWALRGLSNTRYWEAKKNQIVACQLKDLDPFPPLTEYGNNGIDMQSKHIPENIPLDTKPTKMNQLMKNQQQNLFWRDSIDNDKSHQDISRRVCDGYW